MKKTQFIELFRIIKKTKVTFVAIILFVAMGMALFFGIDWTSTGIELSSNDFFVKGKLADAEIQYVYGFDEEIVDRVAAFDGVGFAEGYYKAYEFLKLDGTTYEVRITSLTDNSNLPVIVDGTLPEAVGEIAVEGAWAKKHNVKVGDTLVFTHDGGEPDYLPTIVKTNKNELIKALAEKADATDEDGMRYLLTDTFSVTALVETAQYLQCNPESLGVSYPDAIPVNSLMFVSRRSIDETAFPGYTNIAVTLANKGEESYFSESLKARQKELTETLSPLITPYTDKKNADIADKKDVLTTLGMTGLDSVKEYPAVVTDASDNVSVALVSMMSSVFGKLRYSMAGLFVLVGLLVCFFTVSRIVYENAALIGTKKALGFTNREIRRTYLLYAGIAAAVGSVIGAVCSVFVVEPIIFGAIKDIFMFDRKIYFFDLIPAVIFAISEIAVQMLTVYIACRRLFKKDTLQLLRGGDAAVTTKTRLYEKLRLWKTLSLFLKTVINNFFNDKRRVLSTVIGVASCTTLVVSALTMNNHITGSFTEHYDRIYNYDGVVYFESDALRDDMDAVLTEKSVSFTPVYSTDVALGLPSGKTIAAHFFVADKADLLGLMNLSDVDSKNGFDGGFWTNCAYANEFAASAGDKLKITDGNNIVHTVTADGFFEHYLINNVIVTDSETYLAEFGEEAKPNTYFISKEKCSIEELETALSDCDGFIYIKDDYQAAKESFHAFADIFALIVAVYLVLAVAMALLVLLNLFVMFVSEKKGEVLTLLVNGYRMADARRYIFLDTIVLAVAGIIIGTVSGTVTAGISLEAYQTETINFLSGVDINACLVGIVVAALLTAGTAAIALCRISKFKLTEINA